MGTLKVPYWKWRNGRPRWEPGGKGGARLRAAGFHGRDLKDETGAWLGMEASIAAANAINAEVAQWRAGGRPRLVPPSGRSGPQRPKRCCEALFVRFMGGLKNTTESDAKAAPDFQRLAKKTRNEYRKMAGYFLDADFRDKHVRAVDKPIMMGWWEEAYRKRGHAMANAILAVARLTFSYAERIGWLPAKSNPGKELARPTVEPRIAIWLPEQAAQFLKTADELVDDDGRRFHSVGDAFVIGLHTGQRLGDVLAMQASLFGRQRIALTQMKRSALVDVKMTPQVLERVAAARRRRAEGSLVQLDGPLIINEVTGEAYNPNIHNKRFRAVREAAAKALPKVAPDERWTGPKIYEIAELRYQDLRDTFVTRMWQVPGMTAARLGAITGHSLETIHQIMKHYLAINRALGDEAIDGLVKWLEQEGIAV